ncbi:hypothetical protein PVAP13_4KG201906 [Panicum virgatum]|uniref:Uncharacterized protein n=1 Tax=Panicum virgatum TaxID=38727 RepID=A0A8T0TRS8_PANVG|nr:hypothetical protein PVAP13_4KG201906 [Panicum virgatum]
MLLPPPAPVLPGGSSTAGRPAHRWRFLCRSFPLRCCLMLARFGARARAPHARASSKLVFLPGPQLVHL